jgi:hypothetical protein
MGYCNLTSDFSHGRNTGMMAGLIGASQFTFSETRKGSPST